MDAEGKTVLVTGGAGYVGAVLVPRLLEQGFRVKVLDLFIYGDDVLRGVQGNSNLEQIRGDIRDQKLLRETMRGCYSVIHLACISNDPSFELDPELGRSINFDAFGPLVDIAIESGVQRFIYASSSSVYGLKSESDVTEDLALEPLTDYSKYKALCEEILLEKRTSNFTTLILRPATICGYSPRLRLDLTVNILTSHAFHNRLITVFGGTQMRPNLHIEDMAALYVKSLKLPAESIDGKIYNAGYENHRVSEIAMIVKSFVGPDVQIVTKSTDDNRSYHISSEKIRRELDFIPKHTLQDAVSGLVAAFNQNLVPDALTKDIYYNIRKMQGLSLA
ncbi:MAG: SDR family oxidoreductase [Verrucomicrobia bacterium]|nr:SDR family oxidoreductase [Verrucomicrobiota bacterium]